MALEDDAPIRVHETWDGWRYAEARASGLRDVHWLQPPGAPHPLIHAFVSCTSLSLGSLAHQCDPSSAPHQLRVCVLKRHTTPSAYAALAERAELVRTHFSSILTIPRADASVGPLSR